MYNTSFFQICILLIFVFLLFGDINKVKTNITELYKNFNKKN